MMNSRFPKQAGLTAIEAAVGMGLLILVAYTGFEVISAVRSVTKATQILSSTERQVSAIAENLRTGLELYQLSFDYSPKMKDIALEPSTLPMAWDVGFESPVEGCETCPGRYGYVVQPFEAMRGLYLVTLRLTHREWKEKFKDYEFVVTIK